MARVKICCPILLILLLVAPLATSTPMYAAASDVTTPKKDTNVLLDSREARPPASSSIDRRKVLEKPKPGLLWADWSDQYGLGLLSKLSATLAGFVFIAIMAVLQASAKREPNDSLSDSYNQAFGATLSALMAAFLVLIIAADLFSRCCGDAIELRQQVVEALSNFVLATGLVLMMFGINWALEVYQPHASVKWTARWVFWGMLVYTWTVLIPHYGWTVEAVVSYLRLDAAAATTSQYHWHQDNVLFAGLILLIAGPPILAALAARSKVLMNKSIPLYEKRYWTVCIVAVAVLASIWCQAVEEGVRYTGDPYHPIILEDLTRFLLYHHPRLFCAVLIGIYGLFSASCIIHLPREAVPEKSSVRDREADGE
jgi:hypothetical protein